MSTWSRNYSCQDMLLPKTIAIRYSEEVKALCEHTRCENKLNYLSETPPHKVKLKSFLLCIVREHHLAKSIHLWAGQVGARAACDYLSVAPLKVNAHGDLRLILSVATVHHKCMRCPKTCIFSTTVYAQWRVQLHCLAPDLLSSCTQRPGGGRRRAQTKEALCTDGHVWHKRKAPENENMAGAADLFKCSLTGGTAGPLPDTTQGQRARCQPALRTRARADNGFQMHRSAWSSIMTTCATIEERGPAHCHRVSRGGRMAGGDLHFTALHQLDEVGEEDVSVPLAKALSVVGHLEDTHTLSDISMWFHFRRKIEFIRPF